MRSQGSLEFIMLLAAVVALSTVIFGVYIRMQKSDYSAVGNFLSKNANVPVSTDPAPYGNVSVNVYSPNRMYIGNSSSILSMFSGGYNSMILDATLVATNAIVIPSSYSDVPIYGDYILRYDVMPTSTGYVDTKLYANVMTDNTIQHVSGSAESYSFSSQPADALSTDGYSASIAYAYDNIVYNTSMSGAMYTVSISSHCAKSGWAGGLLDLNGQCGAGAAWDYYIESADCYYGAGARYRAYCVYKKDKGADIYSTSPVAEYNYSITLGLKNSSLNLSSGLSSADASNGIFSADGTEYGNAVVSGHIFGNGYTPPPHFIEYGNKSIPVNSSEYQTYTQYLNSMYSLLEYYNGTKTSDSASSSMSESISSFDSEAIMLMGLNSTKTNCTISHPGQGYAYVCQAYQVLQFSNITATIKGYNKSESVNVEGSTINLK